MNILFEITKNDTPYMKSVLMGINREVQLKSNANLFKIDRKLEKCNMSNRVNSNNIPHFNKCYLIKNNSIFLFESFITSENLDIRFSAEHIVHKSAVTVINLNLNDVGGLENVDIFADMTEMISYSMNNTIDFMIMLFKLGFEMFK